MNETREPKTTSLSEAVSCVAWGYVFLHLDFNLGGINVLPDWACYALVLHALPGLARAERSALLLRPLSETGGALALLADALPRQRLTAETLAAYAGFAPGALPPGVEPGALYDFRTRPLPADSAGFLRTLAAFAKGAAGAPVRAQAALTRRYLREQGIGAGTLLVDIGSGGTTQRILEELTGAELQGFYLACDARLHAALPAARAQAFLFGGRPAPLWYWAGQPML